MPEDNILVAVHRDAACELLWARGWTCEADGWNSPNVSTYGWSLSGALHIALSDEAKQLREQAKA